MLKQAVACLLAAWACMLATPAIAQSVITPFNDLQWEDNFTSAAQKILKIPGIEKCQVSFFYRKAEVRSRDAQSLAKLPAQLLKMKAAFPMPSMPLPGYKREMFTEMRTGKQYAYVSGGRCEIAAGPVTLCDVPFQLVATFELNPGLFLYNPGNCLVTEDNLFLPLVLRSVKLHSNSKALPIKGASISTVISAKYFGGKPLGGVSLQKDATGTNLSVSAGKSQYNIEYGAVYGSGYSQSLRKAYNSYLTRLELNAKSGKPDMSSGL